MITTDLPYSEYHDLPGLRSSALRRARTSMLHYRHDPGRRDSASRTVLKALHCLVLEPDSFARHYAVYDGRRDPRTKLYQAWQACHPGQSALTLDEHARILHTAEAIRSHPVAGPILRAPGDSEVTITWSDPATGLGCKARLDRWIPDGLPPSPARPDQVGPVIVDLKGYGTTIHRDVARMARRLGADLQAAHYRAGVRAEVGQWARYLLIVYEMAPPYDVAVYELTPIDLALVHVERDVLLARIADCERSGVWPGCGPALQDLALPHYADDVEADDVITTDDGDADWEASS